MKKIMKILLATIGGVLAAFGAYALWDGHVREKELYQKALEAEKRAAFIERRRARAREKAALAAVYRAESQARLL